MEIKTCTVCDLASFPIGKVYQFFPICVYQAIECSRSVRLLIEVYLLMKMTRKRRRLLANVMLSAYTPEKYYFSQGNIAAKVETGTSRQQ